MGVSHSRLTMSADGDIKVFSCSRGRPDSERVKILNCPKKMQKELEDLRSKLNFAEGTEILLALSVATDDMIRHVHMFPEVSSLPASDGFSKKYINYFLWIFMERLQCHVLG